MAAVVINHLSLDVSVDQVADVVDRKYGDVLRDQPGFQRFYFVKTGERDATLLSVWASESEAKLWADGLGRSLFETHIAPHLAKRQERMIGKVVAEASI